MKLPGLKSLQAFNAVGRHLSIRRAAEELGIDHSVVSRHLRALQDELGLRLVETTRHGVALTPAGRDYHAVICAAFDQMVAATAQLAREAGHLRLAVWSIPGFALRWLTPRLDDFRRHSPRIELVVRSTDVHPDLLAFEADIEIAYGRRRAARGLRSLELIRPRVFPVASPAWVATHARVRAPADLLGVPLIHEESIDQWKAWLEAAGVAAPDRLSGPRLWHAHLAIEAASRGQGVALANELIAGEAVDSGELVEVTQSAITLEPYVFAARSDRWREPHIARFRRWLLARLQRSAAST
jgi:LysR family transcriptional regulator, glycine cleavage system transcriptional activator